MLGSRRQSNNFNAITPPPPPLPPPGVLADDSLGSSIDDIQIALAPHIQSFLSQTGRRHSCCSVMLPVTFERAASQSWLDPKFDSPVLEGQYKISVFPHIRMRYRFTLYYVLLCSMVWFFYFLVDGGFHNLWRPISSSFSLLALFTIIAICFTHCDTYRSHHIATSAITATILCGASLTFLIYTGRAFSPLGHFAMCLEIVVLIYTALPMKLWLSSVIAITYTILFETVTHLIVTSSVVHGSLTEFSYKIFTLRILCHLCVHFVGLHILIMNLVRMRGTFMKVGQNLLVRRQLEMEKQLKEKMIHSVMPPKVANILLNEGAMDSVNDSGNTIRRESNMRPRPSNDVKSLFRPFHMHSMDNVSILFADIVGFTRMSSTKTAEQLVEILNDLFERFDDLCTLNGCEKISTLGDCYYCVSGCPEPRSDHAVCCVEMGLGMIDAMRCFDAQRHEGVKMRVGVHTGSVLCGIVGTRRVKFDVWSNDVSLANKMESTGKPEQVHISEETANFLGDAYYLEEGEEVFGHHTYFVIGRRKDVSRTNSIAASVMPNCIACSHLMLPNASLSQSVTNMSATQPNVPPASPVGQLSTSLNPSPILSFRPRLASLSMKLRKKSQAKETDAEQGISTGVRPIVVVHEKPKIIITNKSLPDSLDQEQIDIELHNDDITNANIITNHMQTKAKVRLKLWNIPNFLKKLEKISKPLSEKSKSLDVSHVGIVNSSSIKINTNEETVAFIESTHHTAQPLSLPVISTIVEVNTVPKSSSNVLDIPQIPHISTTGSPALLNNHSPDNTSCSPGQFSVFDDVIDIRSYISQSRSDISPFDRSGSSRSKRAYSSGGQLNISPTPRQRTATLNTNRLEIPSTTQCMQTLTAIDTSISSQPNHSHSSTVWPDGLSICPSATSRKDSGIKSNSRRSSIQHQIYALNQTTNISQHRVSGYFTSSASSISNLVESTILPHIPLPPIQQPTAQVTDPLAACLQQLRKQSDLQLIRCVRDNAKSERSYLVKPPLKKFSLYFKSYQMEKDFRSKAHRFGSENETEGPPTLATPRYNTYIDIFVGLIIYLCISISLFLITPNAVTPNFRLWVLLFMCFTAFQAFALFLFTRQMCRRLSRRKTQNIESCADRIFESISNWYPWHICLAILMAMPVILIMANFVLLDLNQLEAFEYHYGILIFVCIIHFCNFTQLNCWMRNILAFLAALCFVGIAISQLIVSSNRPDPTETIITIHANNNNDTLMASRKIPQFIIEEIKWFQDYHVEIYLDLFLLLVLIWFLNREFEIGYRLTFYGNAVANQDKIQVQNMKNQADMLLHNIIPKHVAEQLKNTAKYSENHHNVGIIFASIINFNEMYDESYLGGKEYLRVLNELIGDFDELLSRPEFKSVEKIKTIGSTFMAASGLDPNYRDNDFGHIHALMEFSLAMQDCVKAFNKDLLEFNLILRIGFNVGDVTAGVIGTSKLHYDIWGDAVNVASRMDSTGLPNRIQVGKDCLVYLNKKYEFEPRGSVYVKGKDNMEVYLYIQRRPDTLNDDNDNGNDTEIDSIKANVHINSKNETSQLK